MNRFITFQVYHLKEEREEEFIATWKLLNDLNFRYSACMEARIHREGWSFYEYLTWPDLAAYRRSKASLPPAALALRARLRSCCKKAEEQVEMELILDQRSTSLKPFH